jgi:hypothetical protein
MREAVAVCRTLVERPAQGQSEKWRAEHDLAKMLTNLALLLDADLYARRAALEAMRAAAGIYGTLAEFSPSLYVHRIAHCFHFLRVRLNAFGPSEAALEAAREEANIYRPLATWLPFLFASDFRRSVQNLRYQLWAAGRDPDTDAALEAVERAAVGLGFTISRPGIPMLGAARRS